MQSNCILDSVANLLVRHMVFVGNIQKSSIASHLKGIKKFDAEKIFSDKLTGFFTLIAIF